MALNVHLLKRNIPKTLVDSLHFEKRNLKEKKQAEIKKIDKGSFTEKQNAKGAFFFFFK